MGKRCLRRKTIAIRTIQIAHFSRRSASVRSTNASVAFRSAVALATALVSAGRVVRLAYQSGGYAAALLRSIPQQEHARAGALGLRAGGLRVHAGDIRG